MNPLALDPEAMRAMGHRTVDLMVDMLGDPEVPALRRATPAEMSERLPFGEPAAPEDFEALLERLQEDVFPFMSRMDHPGYFAFIPGSGTFPGALADFMASALNIYVGSWMEAAGPSRLELIVLDWFKRWIGYPSEAAGSLVSGGSAANITALACAREALLGAMNDRVVAYVADQAHSSMARAARLLGFRPDQVRVLPTDAAHRLQPETVLAAIDADADAGRQPLFVSAAAGSTNTGAIDPLAELAQVCRERGVWLHVDAAYGGFAALTDRGRERLAGLELADSVTLDPHKWLYQSYECGSLLVRDGRHLRRAFEIVPDYLSDARGDEDEVNFSDLGIQLSRTSRALKVWLSISHFGVDAFRRAIDASLDLAQHAEEIVESTPELELMSPASLGIICFRRRGDEGASEHDVTTLNKGLVAAFEASGHGLVSSTQLRGRYAIRFCAMNHTSRAEDVERALDFFASGKPARMPGRPAAPVSRAASVDDGWLGESVVGWEELERVPLLSCLDHADLDRVARWAREQRVPAGEVAIRRWDAARDFFLVLEGAAVVECDGVVVADLAAGDFFGERAALDWGAGYGYARSATVRATAPLRLLALSPAHLEQLMQLDPAIATSIHAAIRAQLAAT
jgi:aromatic-L-amino-acid decarboxylase